MQEDKQKPDSIKKKRPETLADEQAEHQYYYDDAHGYEDFDPDKDDDEDEASDKECASSDAAFQSSN